ncbi:hypothetical protein FSW04_19795 [Baekduia soli]|uniref:Calcium-binding protein n=1 Tax=Baekduia soli TaxID=496014 RepID=A0A5B8UAF9_9ACTN|nr:hypothetical protein [Baekduia soli]QEC49591.1 hypothetical protein FSW04_19795 [Baekduia soli]
MRRTRFTSAVAALTLIAVPAAASAHGSHHKVRDSDHDGMPNTWEVANHLNAHKADANGDPDHDGLRNLAEYKDGTNPRNADTNGNGVPDNHDVAGTVTSFTNGVLTITLPDGSTRTGTVDADTRVMCMPSTPASGTTPSTATPPSSATPVTPTARSARHGGDDGAGDGQDPASSATPGSSTLPVTPGTSGHDQGDDDGSENDGGPNGHGQHRGNVCAPGALAAGAKVHEAELKLTGSGAVWEKIQLLS